MLSRSMELLVNSTRISPLSMASGIGIDSPVSGFMYRPLVWLIIPSAIALYNDNKRPYSVLERHNRESTV